MEPQSKRARTKNSLLFHYSAEKDGDVPEDVVTLCFMEPLQGVPSELCFQRKHLKEVSFVMGLKYIERSAFEGCTALEIVLMPASLEIIWDRAFYGCSELSRARVPSAVKIISDFAFADCCALEDVELPNGLLCIGQWAFRQCWLLTRIAVPSTVEVIAQGTFCQCTELREVELKAGLTAIRKQAFFGCSSLKRIEVPPTVEIIHNRAFCECVSLVDVILQDGLRVIDGYAFGHCDALENIVIPSTVETLGVEVFFECDKLHYVDIRAGLTELLCSIKGCEALRFARLPSTLSILGKNAFYMCSSLVELSLPIGLKVMKARCLMKSVSLTGLYIPSTVENIEDEAFSDCRDLVTVEFPRNMMATVGENVFNNCVSLINISIPSGMTQENANLIHAGCFGQGCWPLIKHFGEDNLAQATTDRYDGYLVHAACYHSNTTTVEDLEEQITASGWYDTEGQLDLQKKLLVDQFGMTPFHVLASAAKLRNDLLDVLLRVYPSYVLWWSDAKNEYRVIDYLVRRRGTEDIRFALEMFFHKLMVERLSDWGRDEWRSQMEANVDELVEEIIADVRSNDSEMPDTAMPATFIYEDLLYAYEDLAKYELVASASLLELLLWKRALNAEGATSAVVDRATCRVRRGAEMNIIIPNVLDFLKDDEFDFGRF